MSVDIEMFPNCHAFSIERSTLNAAQTQHITYNITVAAENSTQSNKDLQKQWDEYISKIKAKTEKKDDEDGDDESVVKAEPTTKDLVIYTDVDIARKKLKRSINVVLTLTPATSDSKSWPTIVWKTLHFEKTTTKSHQVKWSNEAGFCVLNENEDGTLIPGDLRQSVYPGYLAILKDVDGENQFEGIKLPDESNNIAVWNMTSTRKRFALCTLDPTKPETDRFSPVVDLDVIGSMSSEQEHIFQCGPPVLLQAYVISNYQERKPIKTADLKRPLFLDTSKSSKPIDIRNLGRNTSFRLYSDDAGNVILEKD